MSENQTIDLLTIGLTIPGLQLLYDFAESFILHDMDEDNSIESCQSFNTRSSGLLTDTID